MCRDQCSKSAMKRKVMTQCPQKRFLEVLNGLLLYFHVDHPHPLYEVGVHIK